MYNLHRLLNFFIFAISLLLLLFPTNPQYDQSLEHLHTTLATFLSRGQTFVESFPPLSLLLATNCSPSVLRYLGILARGLKVTQLLWGLSHSSAKHATSWYFNIAGISIGTLGFEHTLMDSESGISALSVARSFADVCLIFVVIAYLVPDALPAWLQIILPEMAMSLAMLLGCNWIHWISVLLHLETYRLHHFFERLADKNKSVWYHFGVAGYHALLQFSCAVFFISVVLFQTYPFSETSAGGNWNLRYLSAATRRTLRNGHPPSSLLLSEEERLIPRYGIVPETSASIYIQGAGFLYTDDQIWDHSIAAFRPTYISEEQYRASARAIFIDSIRYTAPWFFEQVLYLDETLDDELNNTPLAGHLWSGQHVRLRSGSTGKYLAIEPGTLSIVDRLNFLNVNAVEGGIRWAVSTSADPEDMSSLWTLIYTPNQSSAFRLRNNLEDCYLATSYRSFPDWDAIHGNDTVLQGLRMELEVTCSTDVTLAASTFDIVDGYLEFGLIPEQKTHLSNLIEYVKKNVSYQSEMITAMLSLYNFRKKHTTLQDTPSFLRSTCTPTTVFSRAHHETTGLILSIFFITQIYHIACLQRSSEKKQFRGKDFKKSMTSKIIGLLLVIIHLIWYYIPKKSTVDQEGVILVMINLMLAN